MFSKWRVTARQHEVIDVNQAQSMNDTVFISESPLTGFHDGFLTFHVSKISRNTVVPSSWSIDKTVHGLGDRGVAFRLHSRIADLDASVLIEFLTKSARKLVVQPPMTVGLWFCFAPFMTSLASFFFLPLSSPHETVVSSRGAMFRYLSSFVFKISCDFVLCTFLFIRLEKNRIH